MVLEITVWCECHSQRGLSWIEYERREALFPLAAGARAILHAKVAV